jgi:hypothetical protein
MFGKKTETKDKAATISQIERSMGGALRDMADLSKQKITENIVGMVRSKRIKSEISESDLRTLLSVAEMSVDQSLTSIGNRVSKLAKDAAE